MNRSLLYFAMFLLTIDTTFAQTQLEKLKMPGPDVQNLMLGSWSIQVRYAPTSDKPKGSTGEGTEIWRPGPGGLSVIEEYRDKNENGDVEGLGVAWWDSKAQGQRFVWCDNSNPDGCYISKEVAKWDGESLVWKEEQENAGKRRTYTEVFRDITPSSFTQVLGQGQTGEVPQTMVTIRATKLLESATNETAMRSTEHDLHMAMADRQKAMLAGDADSIDRLTAEEYVQTDIFGHVQDKSAWLREYFLPLAALMKAGKFHWDLYEEKDVAVHMFSDTAVVTGSLHMKGTGARVAGRTWQEAPNTSIEANLRFTRVWIKRDGAWRVAALHNALTPMTAANGDAPSHQP